MNLHLKQHFLQQWEKYFGSAELPITCYYTSGTGGAEWAEKPGVWNCLICELSKVRKGRSLVFNSEVLGCGGSRRYLGYTTEMRPGFEYFLSCGNEKMEGERYIRTPEMVREIMKRQQTLPIEGKNIVFKRWDKLEETDHPEIIIFFATPDVLSGLYTLTNYDYTDGNAVYTPFGAGCSSIVHHPYLEMSSENPRAVIGMFDPSARPCVPKGTLSFAVPWKKFERMISCMDESFLITETWQTLSKRLQRS